ncbi:MAG TPA: NAD(P)/FAD-dependent oxidoreductase [Bacteroidia bacterium]|nr:NAD(P)/FAD-dependent oxidoreductase [Bacteroidia bacterium]
MAGKNEAYDTIIIGSGAGGLATAICLARAGQKVLVLEQHYVPGGWCHSFHLNGQRFSPGVHYVGLLGEGQSTRELYEGLGVANDMVFFRMNKKAYEHCWIGNERIDLPAGMEELQAALSEKFPHENKRLKKYLNLISRVSKQIQLIPKMNGFWDNVTIPFRTKDMGKYGLFSLKRVLNWHIKDPLLKAVLSIQCGDHGLPPYKASFPVHCAVMEHYFDGAFYPMGGGAGIVKAMTNAIKRHDGEIRTGQRVKKIIVEDKTAKGIELEDGTKIFSTRIVSNADPSTTFEKMIGTEHLSQGMKKRLAKTTYSVTSLILFVTVDLDVTQAGIDSGNIWYLKNKEVDELYQEMISKDVTEGTEFPGVFISCTTLKDPASFNGRYHSFEAVTFIDYDSFDEFNHSKDYHGENYLRFKEKIIAKFLNNLEKIIPGFKEKIVQVDLGTPKTNEYYLNTTRGSVYGTEKTFKQIGPFAFSNKSEIKNLYLCGASTLSHGVGGATYSGVHAAAKILKCRSEELIVSDENQNIRIYEAEDRSDWPDWLLQKIADKKRRFKELPKIKSNLIPEHIQ